MISFDDRMALVRAGYTATQIAEFDATAGQTKTQQEQEQNVLTQTQQGQTQQGQGQEQEQNVLTQTQQGQVQGQGQEQNVLTQTQQGQTQQENFASMIQSLNNSILAMVGAMQAQNIKGVDMITPENEKPEDILAKLLNP